MRARSWPWGCPRRSRSDACWSRGSALCAAAELPNFAGALAAFREHESEFRFRQPVLRPEALRFAEAALGILHGAGFESAEATRAFRLLFTYVFGFAGLSPEQTAEEARRQAAAAIAILPPERYPNLTRAGAEASAAMAGEEQFEYGLERILDGLEARLAITAAPPATAGARAAP